MGKKKRLVRSLPVSEDSISALSGRVGKRNGKSKSNRPYGLCLPKDFPKRSGSMTSENAGKIISSGSIASRRDSLVRTSPMQVHAGRKASSGWKDRGRDCFLKSYVSSKRFNPLGWCLKMSRRCSIRAIAKTCRQSSMPLPTAGIWDFGECLMLNISESPRSVVEFSWLQVLDATPHWSSWLTPRQWKQYLARLFRNLSDRQKVAGQVILLRQQDRSVWVVRFSSLKRTHGIRWLSGNESLAYMGFAKDWMKSISPSDMQLAMRLSRRSPSGSPESWINQQGKTRIRSPESIPLEKRN